MLFYLFIIFQILYSVSCYISCYNTPFDANSFNYIVTVDNLPTELHNSTLEANSIGCDIEVIWRRAPENTQITLVAEINEKAISTNHDLEVGVGYQNDGSIIIWEKVIRYRCHTDQCNSLSQLKLLLSSLVANDNLIDLIYLLDPVKPFKGEWCDRRSNATFDKCDITIPIDLCRQCQLTGIMNQTTTELCATCSTDDPDTYEIGYGTTFNMIDRTYSSIWVILCGRENCNTPAIGDSIREKSSIAFDFNKFLNNKTTILSMNKMVLVFMVFFMKFLH